MSQLDLYLQGERPVLMDFRASWSARSRKMAPLMEELKYELSDKVNIVNVDIEECPSAFEKYGVEHLPTTILFKGGKQLWKHVGAVPKQMLVQMIHAAG